MATDLDNISRTREPCDFIYGPSHIIRWKRMVNEEIFPLHINSSKMVGKGGLPIWSRWLNSELASRNNFKIGLFVGDFRFGNSICGSTKIDSYIFCDSFYAIDRTKISENNDLILYRRSLAALDMINTSSDGNISFIFWCLFCSEVTNRLSRKYFVNGKYKHPTWNYSDLETLLPNLDIIDLKPLLRMAMHEVNRLFIDKSGHPSTIGFLFLDYVLGHGYSVKDSYAFAVNSYESKIFQVAKDFQMKYHKPIIITGSSVWLKVMVNSLGSNGQKKLAKLGLIIAPVNKIQGRYTLSDLTQNIEIDQCHVTVISADVIEIKSDLAFAFAPLLFNWDTVEYLDWESSAKEIIQSRNIKADKISQNKSALSSTIPLLDSMVELGENGEPTFSGITFVLNYIMDSAVSQPLNRLSDYRVDGNVLIYKNKIAYLIGGSHAILKYATGQLSPSEISIRNFSENITARAVNANISGSQYLHVIFPDKQSVEEEHFPFKPLIKLGDLYLDKVNCSTRNFIIYPVKHLQAISTNSFLPLDTHLSDTGSRFVLELILNKLGIAPNPSLSTIEQCTNERKLRSGDLGSKLSPPLFAESLHLKPSWPLQTYSSSNKYNDGAMDIIYSSNALSKKTILIFGDSFFRLMLPHFSCIFNKVIFLRSRFWHQEMFDLIKPDIVLTGNAERYLSEVSSDREAPAFYLYPAIRGDINYYSDPHFLQALRAITSPNSSVSFEFFSKLENTLNV